MRSRAPASISTTAPAAAPTSAPSRPGSRVGGQAGARAGGVLALGCLALACVLVPLWGSVERARVSEAVAQAPVAPPSPAPADVARAMRAMKLVTVEIDTTVSVRRGDTSWRGDVAASVEVPVRLAYGTDLSGLAGDAVGVSVFDGLVVRIPPPQRVATEVFPERERTEVETGWLRMRSRAGEYYLGLARRDAAQAAREMTLRPEDQARVERVTVEQVTALVKSIVGGAVPVKVVVDRGGTLAAGEGNARGTAAPATEDR
ncbi:MAG: DUF4230 domain-containing protein [Planctomycetota bacterium]|nr:DUF4230 domain-containing protein [Planctomycetota bacterium]